MRRGERITVPITETMRQQAKQAVGRYAKRGRASTRLDTKANDYIGDLAHQVVETYLTGRKIDHFSSRLKRYSGGDTMDIMLANHRIDVKGTMMSDDWFFVYADNLLRLDRRGIDYLFVQIERDESAAHIYGLVSQDAFKLRAKHFPKGGKMRFNHDNWGIELKDLPAFKVVLDAYLLLTEDLTSDEQLGMVTSEVKERSGMNKNGSFLPDQYEGAGKETRYLRFEEGANKFRVLGKPLIGYRWWVDKNGNIRQRDQQPQAGDKPVRVALKVDEGTGEVHTDVVPEEALEIAKEFWAMPVWNYKLEKVQILEVTQRSILRTITSLARNEAWGHPAKYDLTVVRKGERLDTVYEVIPNPPTPIADQIKAAAKEIKIDLNKLLTGDNPFGDEKGNTEAPPPPRDTNTPVMDEEGNIL